MRLTKGGNAKKKDGTWNRSASAYLRRRPLSHFSPEKAGMEEQFLTEQEAQALTADRKDAGRASHGFDLCRGSASLRQRSRDFSSPCGYGQGGMGSRKLQRPGEQCESLSLDNPFADAKQEAVREGKSYRLLAVKGERFRQYAVVFSGLPILCIDTDSGTEIRYEEAYGTMRLYHADTKENWVTESLMSAHIRGGSSRLNPKKSYKMTLYKKNQTGSGSLRKNNKSLLGMREDNEWLIYAMYSEDSKVRDKLSLEIWNNSGALSIESNGFYGYHMEYMEVIQNGEHWGIYGLMEPVDYKQLDLTKENEAQPEIPV